MYRLLSRFFQYTKHTFPSPPLPLPFVFLVIPTHLYFVSVRMSGIDRETQEEAIIVFFLDHCTLTYYSVLGFFFSFFFFPLVRSPRSRSLLDPLFLLFLTKRNETKRRDDQWMQRSDTFRQYITINYTYIIIN